VECVPNIILFRETEEPSDFGSTLGTQSLRVDDVSQARDVCIALLDDREREDREVIADDAAADGFALALTGASGSVAGVAVGEEELDSGGEHLVGRQVSANFVMLALLPREGRSCTYNTLLHGKALLVVAASDADDL
jgi:hypothetical protein